MILTFLTTERKGGGHGIHMLNSKFNSVTNRIIAIFKTTLMQLNKVKV